MNGDIVTLVSNASATGSSCRWQGGKGVITAEATWGGGSVTLEFKSPNGTWVTAPIAAFSANGSKTFELPIGEIRAAIATATAVYAYAYPYRG